MERHDGGRRQRRVREHAERRVNDRVLTVRVIRRVEGIAVPKWDHKGPRGAHPLGHLAKQVECDGRDPLPLKLGGDQTHGLVAHGSHGNQERHVGLVLDEQPACRRGALSNQRTRRGDRAHERQMARTHRADSPLRRELA